MKQAVNDTKVLHAGNAASAGTDYFGTTIDMSGFEGVMFIATIGTANAGNGLKAQQAQQSDASDAADLEGSLTSDAAATTIVLDIHKPRERYVRAVVDRSGANTTVDSIIAILYNGRTCPVDNSAPATQVAKLVVSPAEGTA